MPELLLTYVLVVLVVSLVAPYRIVEMREPDRTSSKGELE